MQIKPRTFLIDSQKLINLFSLLRHQEKWGDKIRFFFETLLICFSLILTITYLIFFDIQDINFYEQMDF